MITNERQYKVTTAELEKFKRAVDSFDLKAVIERTNSKILAQAELDALSSEIEVLSDKIQEYELLKAGGIRILKAESLEGLPFILIRARIARGFTQREFAEKLGMKEQQIQRYESERYASASLKRLSEVARGLDLNISEVAELQDVTVGGLNTSIGIDLNWKLFPVKEMYKRNWFTGFQGSFKAALTEADELVEAFVKDVIKCPAVAMQRQRVRSESKACPYSLFAWQCQVLQIARLNPPKTPFILKTLDENWVKELVQLSYDPNGIKRATGYLRDSGIVLVVVPHLPKTHLDGAALLDSDMAIVGLTLRYDRLDNFWFVLLHEVIHIIKHLRKGGIEDIFDDLEADPDELEIEADTLAGEALIPEEKWEMAVARYVQSKESVLALADELKINPAIIAGRIRKETDNYTILKEFIGQGEVRKCFPKVYYGE